MRKRVLIILCIGILMITMCGCTIDDCVDNYNGSLNERASANVQVVERFRDNGIITAETAEQLAQTIHGSADKIETKAKSGSDDDTGVDDKLHKYISWVSSDLPDRTGGDYTKSVNLWTYLSGKSIGTGARNAEPYQLLTDDEIASLNSTMQLNIYILKENTSASGESMEKLTNAIARLKGGDGTSTDKSTLDAYFKSSGKTLLDLDTTPIIKDTVLTPYSEISKTDPLGSDMVLKADNKIAVAIRLKEFNPEAVEKILGSDSITKDKYLRVDNRLYLLEYPVKIVDGLSVDVSDNKKFNVSTAESDLVVNIMSGQMQSKTGEAMVSKPEGQEVPMYNILGSGTDTESFQSSFMLYGNTDYAGIGAKGETVTSCAAIVLKDYLELTYMPDLIQNENFVALGRKIRVEKMSGTNSDVFARFIDKNGNLVKSSDGTEEIAIYATDIIDTSANTGENIGYQTSLSLGREIATEGAIVSDSAITGMYSDSRETLNDKYDTAIKCTYKFPSINLNASDSGTGGSNRMEFYGITTSLNLFETSLYSSWVNVPENSEGGSLLWWNKWLNENSYTYSIDPNILLDYLNGKFTYEMAGNEYILLNLETIKKIQATYDEEDKVDSVTNLRTVSALVGLIAMMYALLLPCAWMIDNNIAVNLGKSFLSMLTFGKWEPIACEDEVPDIGEGKVHYKDLGGVVKGALVIFGFGLLLILLDIIGIVNILVSSLGGFASMLQDKIIG